MTSVVAVTIDAEPSAEAQGKRTQILAEVRERVRLEDIARAKDDLFMALHPAPRHGRAALELLEIDDDAGFHRELNCFYMAAKAAWNAWATLKRLQGAPNKSEEA